MVIFVKGSEIKSWRAEARKRGWKFGDSAHLDESKMPDDSGYALTVESASGKFMELSALIGILADAVDHTLPTEGYCATYLTPDAKPLKLN